jgi:gluconolactonase
MSHFASSITILALLLAGCAPASNTVAQEATPSPVPAGGAAVEAVADGFQFTEGPYWRPESGMLLFSDIPANTIYQWHPEADSTSVYRRPSGRSNGIVAGPAEGSLLLAQHGWRRVARVTPDGRETALATHYNGQRLNSPNDVALRSDGTVYFTDPPYGVEAEARELDIAGVYRLPPGDEEPVLITDEFTRPNGVVLSPDESRLYVNDTRQGLIRAYDVAPSGEVSGGEVFARLEDPDAEGAPDGMTVDATGRLYSTGPGGLWIFAPGGEQLDRIRLPARATNVTFGGAQGQTLFVTTPSAVYRVPVDATGVR